MSGRSGHEDGGRDGVAVAPVLFDDVVESTIGAERFDKKQKLKLWERALFPFSRFGMKLYQLLFKNLTRLSTWPTDRQRSRRLRQSPPTSR